jgi:glyoxylase-like metal-dependent hydrolase (beta-lactamase superfamily II)
MGSQIALDASALADQISRGAVTEILPDVAYRRLAIVNVVFIGTGKGWMLVDAGLFGSASFIKSAAEARFGPNVPPRAIVLTHGHFDHVGALRELADDWDVPVYAHGLEHPYLNGKASYPPPDSSVGGGLMAWSAKLYPRGPIDVGRRLRELPADHSLPDLTGWSWRPTPGHSPGHISLWRESDRSLIAGDAVITTRQESAYAVLTQKPELHGPPMYYTPDWPSARASARILASLHPELMITGHGPPLAGQPLQEGLRRLAKNFDEIAVPTSGRYLQSSAKADDGSAYRPPKGS